MEYPKSSQQKTTMRDVLSLLLRVNQGMKHVFGKPGSSETTVLQIQVLGLLRATPGMSAKEVGEALYLSSSATAQLLQRMVDAKLLKRQADAEDRRRTNLFATKDGEDILEEYARSRRDKVIKIFSALSDEDIQALATGLEKLHHVLQENYNDK